MSAPRKSAFCDYNCEYKGVSLQASFNMFITLLFHVILNFESTKMILVFNIFSIVNLITLRSRYLPAQSCRPSGVFIINFGHISHLVLVFLLLTLNM